MARPVFVLVGAAACLGAIAAQTAHARAVPPWGTVPQGPPIFGAADPGGVTTASGLAPDTIQSTCSGNPDPGVHRYAGFQRFAIPGTGQAASAQINLHSGGVTGSNALSGWVGVDDNTPPPTKPHWIQAGIYKDFFVGVRKYIEYRTSTGAYDKVDEGPATPGTLYFASVTKVSAGSWTASIGGQGLGMNVSLSGMVQTQYQGEATQFSSGTCAFMDYYFRQSSPYGTSVMSPIAFNPYVVDEVMSNGWHSHGG